MNRSHAEHALYTLFFQALIGFPTGLALGWFAGACIGGAFAAGWFISREHTQREYKLTHGGSVKGLRPWEALDVWNWTADAKGDALASLITAGAVIALVGAWVTV